MVSSHQKDCNYGTFYYLDEIGKHHVKWNKLNMKMQISYDSIYMSYPE